MSVSKFILSVEVGGVSSSKKAEFVSVFGLELPPDSGGEYYISEELGPMYMGVGGDFHIIQGVPLWRHEQVAKLFAPFLEDGSVLVAEEEEKNFSLRFTFRGGKVSMETSKRIWVDSRVVHEY